MVREMEREVAGYAGLNGRITRAVDVGRADRIARGFAIPAVTS